MKHGKYRSSEAVFLIDTACARNGCGHRALASLTGISYYHIQAMYEGYHRLDQYSCEVLIEAAGLN